MPSNVQIQVAHRPGCIPDRERLLNSLLRLSPLRLLDDGSLSTDLDCVDRALLEAALI